MERWRKQHGRRLDYEERKRKKEAREGHKASKDAQNLRGLRAKLHAESRRKEKIQMRKQIKALKERNVKKAEDSLPCDPVPHYLLDGNDPSAAKALASSIKQKRNEKAVRFQVPSLLYASQRRPHLVSQEEPTGCDVHAPRTSGKWHRCGGERQQPRIDSSENKGTVNA